MLNITNFLKFYRNVIRPASVYASFNLLTRIVPFLLLPVLTRYLTPADYGIISIFYVIRDGIWPLSSMSTSGAVGRAYFDRNKDNFNFSSYLANAFFVNFLLFLAIAFLFFLLKGYISMKLSFPILWLMMIPVFEYALSVINIQEKLWIFQSRPLWFGGFNLTKIVFNIALSIVLVVVFSMGWKGRVIGIGATEILFSFFVLFLLLKEFKVEFSLNIQYIKDILKFGLPLVPYSIGTLVMCTADKYFLKILAGLSVLGVYTVGYTFGSIVTFIASSVDLSIAPKLYNKLGQPDQKVKRKLVLYLYLYMIFLILVALLVVFLVPRILGFWIGPKFQGAYQFLPWICLGSVFFGMYRALSIIITYTKKTYFLTWSVFIAAPLTILANYFFIKINGPIGAAQAVFVGYLVFFLITWAFVQKVYPLPWFRIFCSKPQKTI